MTFTVANATNCDVFRVFEQNTDDVIDIINYLIERAETKPKTTGQPAAPHTPKKDNFWDYV